MEFVGFMLAQGILFGVLSSNIGKDKGYSSVPFFALGFFLGLLGLLIAFFIRGKANTTSRNLLLKDCPSCKEKIPKEALLCNCGNEFSKESVLSGLIENLYPNDKSMNNNLLYLNAIESINDSAISPDLIKLIDNIITEEDVQEKNVNDVLDNVFKIIRNFGDSDVLIKIAPIVVKTNWTAKAKKLMEVFESFGNEAIPTLILIGQRGGIYEKLAKETIDNIKKSNELL